MHNIETYIVLFDGNCNLCISLVNFIIKRDTKELIKFASLLSERGQALFHKFGLHTNGFDSLVLIIGEKYFLKSSAALHVLRKLGGVWKLFYSFIIFPVPLRDFIYDILAKKRYRLFGKRDTYIIPASEVKRRFLQ